MDTYTLNGSLYLHPTPAGAFFAATSAAPDLPSRFMQRLLTEAETPALSQEMLDAWTGLQGEAAITFLLRLQEAGMVQGLDAAASAPAARLEQLLPPLLAALSGEGRAVLGDARGLVLSSAGYSLDAAEALAGLAADVAALRARHGAALKQHLRLDRHGWGIVAPAGYSELGVWPLQAGAAQVVLVLGGEPRLNVPALTQLLWALGVHHAR